MVELRTGQLAAHPRRGHSAHLVCGRHALVSPQGVAHGTAQSRNPNLVVVGLVVLLLHVLPLLLHTGLHRGLGEAGMHGHHHVRWGHHAGWQVDLLVGRVHHILHAVAWAVLQCALRHPALPLDHGLSASHRSHALVEPRLRVPRLAARVN